MNRLDTIRTYFIERFFALLTSHPEFKGLAEPAELFDAGGSFNVPATLAGFVRLPTVDGLAKRITAATAPQQKKGLERFQRVLQGTVAQLFGSLAGVSTEMLAQAASQFAPVIRHPDSQTYWPVDVGRYLNWDDGTLRSRYYDKTGERSLTGKLFSVMFEDPSVWSGPGLPRRPFESHVPFVATIGTDGTVPAFPTSSLTAGYLNLPAADARLIPGRLDPTIYAEAKSIAAALRANHHYGLTASGGGRFKPLRHNRIHADPLLRRLTNADTRGGAVPGEAWVSQRAPDPLMLVFHSFYPADDGARRRNDGTGTNREFHHLAVGLLLTRAGDLAATPAAAGTMLLFTSTSPTEAAVVPLNHPSLQFVDASGNESAQGSHPIVYATPLQIQAYSLTVDKEPIKETTKGGLDYNPDDWQWWVGLGGAMGTGALIGAAAGPIGALIGAAVGLIVYLLAWLLKKLFGGKKDRKKEWTEQKPWPGEIPRQSFQQSAANDIGPSGTTSDEGGAKPGRSYALKTIPHLPGDNLYGLAFEGGDTCQVVEDDRRNEMLAWLAFEGGIGYQFERPLPGRAESAGTSIQNYFELFLQKYLDLRDAQSEVVYFGS